MITYELSFINSVFDTLPKELTLGRYSLLEYFSPKPVYKKEMAGLFIPARFSQPYRRAIFVEYLTFIVYDIDGGLDYPCIEDLNPKYRDIFFMIYPTYSFKAELHKWRMIIPILQPIEGKMWGRYWPQIEDYFRDIWELPTGSYVDKACKDPCRGFYKPSYDPKREYPEPIINMGMKLFNPVFKEVKLPEKRITKYPQIAKTPSQKAKRWELENIAEERQKIINLLPDIVIRDNIVRGFSCPECGDNDTYLYLNGVGAYCNHANSCSWQGTLYDIAEQQGVL